MIRWLIALGIPILTLILVYQLPDPDKTPCTSPKFSGRTSTQELRVALRRPRSSLQNARVKLKNAQARAARAQTAEQRRRAKRAVQTAMKHLNAAQKAFKAAQRGRKPVIATIQPSAATLFELGRSGSPGPRSVPLTLATAMPVGTPLKVGADLFVRQSDGFQMPQGLRPWAGVIQPKLVRVGFCINPATRLKMHPGTYQGALVVADPRLRPITVPVSFTVSYPYMKNLIASAIVLCGLASIFTYTLRKPDLKGRSYIQWLTSYFGVLTIASGLIAAAIAFAAQYLDADVWGENHTQVFAFIGAVTTAFVTGATAGKLAQNFYTDTEKPTDSKKAGVGS